MGTKIVIVVLCLSILPICKNTLECKNIARTGKYDTLWFACTDDLVAKYSNLFHVKGAKVFHRGVELKTNDQREMVTLDTVYYFRRFDDKFIAVAGMKYMIALMLYYNGDSLFQDVVAKYSLKVKEYKSKNFIVICVSERKWVFGTFMKSMIFYKIDNNGILGPKKSYFLDRIKKGRYNNEITATVKGDSVIIYKNGKVDYVYK